MSPHSTPHCRARSSLLWGLSSIATVFVFVPRSGWDTLIFLSLAGGLAVAALLRQEADPQPPTMTAEEADAATTRLEASVLDALPDGVIVADARGVVRLANAASESLVGVRADQIGRSLLEISRDAAVADAFAGGANGLNVTALSTSADRELRVCSYPLTDGAVLITASDETELRRLEKLRREFVANVSHELKTPLTSIRAIGETLQEGVPDAERAKSFATRVVEQSERLGTLIGDLIRLAQAESQEPLKLQAHRLGDIVEAAVSTASELATRREVSLSHPATDLPAIMTDDATLRTAVDNLIRNALLYTPSGGAVRLRVSEESDAGRSWQRIDVKDTGVGISSADQARIFERFFRVDRARTRSTGGSGLGLSIARHCVQRLGGTLTLVSQIGEGSTFTIRLPAAAGSRDSEGE